MNPGACPACTTLIHLPPEVNASERSTLACPHCGAVLRCRGVVSRKAVSGDPVYGFRLLTAAELGEAHHEVLSMLLLKRAGLRGEPAWTASALATLLSTLAHVNKLKAVHTDGLAGGDEFMSVAEELLDDGLEHQIARILTSSEFKLANPDPETE